MEIYVYELFNIAIITFAVFSVAESSELLPAAWGCQSFGQDDPRAGDWKRETKR